MVYLFWNDGYNDSMEVIEHGKTNVIFYSRKESHLTHESDYYPVWSPDVYQSVDSREDIANYVEMRKVNPLRFARKLFEQFSVIFCGDEDRISEKFELLYDRVCRTNFTPMAIAKISDKKHLYIVKED
uniref:Uncharacterized protein n=1 Tax=Romanomermis culicivorax TaxID=13658 RepID=A0A915JM00_ROMCU